MKKWIDDLYAILIKRGFNTLDNSLKNYDTFHKQIYKELQSGIVQSGQTLSYDLNDYDCKINDIILIKCIIGSGKVAVLTALRISENVFISLNSWGVSPSISALISGRMLNVTNNTDNDLTYKLFIRNI